MLNIRKNLRKLGIVSVSALMLLGVGASAAGASQNAHADNTNETEEQWEENARKGIVPQSTIKEEKHDAQEAVDHAKEHPSDARYAMISISDGEQDINIKPYENILRPIAKKYDAHHVDGAATESQDKNNPKWWYKKAPIPHRHVVVPHNHKHTKKVLNHRKHVSRKKRNHKHVTRANLRKQISHLKKSQRSLRRRISRAMHRKYHGRHANQNINRMKAKYNRNNRQLRKLNHRK